MKKPNEKVFLFFFFNAGLINESINKKFVYICSLENM